MPLQILSHESIQLHISDTRQLVLAELAHCKVSLFFFLCEIVLREF